VRPGERPQPAISGQVMAEALTLWRNGHVATCDESMTVFEQGALLTRGNRIEWVGSAEP
jgi:hypothetical protein